MAEDQPVEFQGERVKLHWYRCAKCGEPTRLMHLHDGQAWLGARIEDEDELKRLEKI